MRAASFGLWWATFRVSTANVDSLYRNDYVHAQWASEHMDDISLHTCKCSGFLVVLISVGLIQARPSYILMAIGYCQCLWYSGRIMLAPKPPFRLQDSVPLKVHINDKNQCGNNYIKNIHLLVEACLVINFCDKTILLQCRLGWYYDSSNVHAINWMERWRFVRHSGCWLEQRWW